jgi:hypothetical protein
MILGLDAHWAFVVLMLSAAVVGFAVGLFVPRRGVYALFVGGWVAAVVVFRFALADPDCNYDCIGNAAWAIVCGCAAFAWTLGLGVARGLLVLRRRIST